MTKNQEIETNTTENKIKLLEVIPADKIYTIHNDLRRYHNKWGKDQVIGLADTSGIENFYSIAQYLTKMVPIVGAGLAIKDDTKNGVIVSGVALYIDYLASRGKEKLFRSEEKKQKLTELNKDIENIYDKYEELVEILKILHDSPSSPELNKLLKSLQTDLNKIAEKELRKEEEKGRLRGYLELVFWTLCEDQSSDIKELVLLNNGIKNLEEWNKLKWYKKIKEEFTRLFISLRKKDGLWEEWGGKWEIRRNEHEKIKRLTSILQTAISENNQGISNEEAEKRIENGVLELETKQEMIKLFWEFFSLKGDLKKLINKDSFFWYEKKNKDKKNEDEESVFYWDGTNEELKLKELKYRDNKKGDMVSLLVEELWRAKWGDEIEKKTTILKTDLQEEVKELGKSNKSSESSAYDWWQWFKNRYGGTQDKNKPSQKESSGLDNDDKVEEAKEITENLEVDLDKFPSEESIINTSQPANVFRKRNISNSKENRPSQEIYELVDLQSKEELQTQIEIPPK